MEDEEILDDEPEGPDEDLFDKRQRVPVDYGTYPWRKPIEIDKALLTPQATSTKLSITVPVFEKKRIAVMVRDNEGKPFFTPEGIPYYNIQEEEVFMGFEAKEVSLPGNEIFNIDLNSSFLTDSEIAAIRSLQILYADLQIQTLGGKDMKDDMYSTYIRAMAIINTAKARDGRTAELSKTTITKGMSEQAIIQKFKEEDC